jgi:hypothetical protein
MGTKRQRPHPRACGNPGRVLRQVGACLSRRRQSHPGEPLWRLGAASACGLDNFIHRGELAKDYSGSEISPSDKDYAKRLRHALWGDAGEPNDGASGSERLTDIRARRWVSLELEGDPPGVKLDDDGRWREIETQLQGETDATD